MSLSDFDSMTQINKVICPVQSNQCKNISKRIFYAIKAHVPNLEVVTSYGGALNSIYIIYSIYGGDKQLSL